MVNRGHFCMLVQGGACGCRGVWGKGGLFSFVVSRGSFFVFLGGPSDDSGVWSEHPVVGSVLDS